MKYSKSSARILSLALSVAMVFTMLPSTVFAEGSDTLLSEAAPKCHTVHTADCGYRQAVAAVPATEGTVCSKACEGEHAADCDYKAAIAETPAIEGTPCTHSCELCKPLDSENANNPPVQAQCSCDVLCTEGKTNAECTVCAAKDADPAACKGKQGESIAEKSAYDKVVELFTALPNAATITAETTEDAKDSSFAQLTGAMAAFDALSADEQALFLKEQSTLYTAAMALNDAITGSAPATIAKAAASTVKERTTTLDLTKAGLSYVANDGVTTKIADPTTASIADTGEGWSWDSITKTLMLNGVQINVSCPDDLRGYVDGVRLPVDAKVVLTNENSISMYAKNVSELYGIYGVGTLTMDGSGSLTLISTCGLYSNSGDIIIDGGTFNICGNNSYDVGIRSNTKDVKINGGIITSQSDIVTGQYGVTRLANGYSLLGNNAPFENNTKDIPYNSQGNPPLVIAFRPVVAFAPSNGTLISTAPVGSSDKISMPADPTWGDYAFAGWYTDQDYTTPFVNAGLTESVMLYAKWTSGGKTVRTIPLLLDSMPSDNRLVTEGWQWNASTMTLSLDGATMHLLRNRYGVIYKEGEEEEEGTSPAKVVTIESEGNNSIISAKGSGVMVSDDLVFKGKGSLQVEGIGLCTMVQGNMTVESGNVTAIAYSGDDENTMGIITGGDLLVSGGTLLATAISADPESNMGVGIMASKKLIITGGDVTAKGSMFAAMIAGGIEAEGAVITGSATIDGAMEKVKLLISENVGMGGSILVLDSDGTTPALHVNFSNNKTDKVAYTGTQAPAPKAPMATKTHNSITLAPITVAGETVEYGYSTAANGKITWQDGTTFATLTANTEYFFFTRVKENDVHKAGTASDSTSIKTRPAPTTVSGTVKDENGNILGGETVTIISGTSSATATTDSFGNYTFSNVAAGVYSIVITKGSVTLTDTVTVAGTPITGKAIQFLGGNKNTVVSATDGTPEIFAGGMNDLLSTTNIGTTLSTKEKADVDNGGSVKINVKADLKIASDVEKDKVKLDDIATGKKIDMLLDLSVLKTVTDKKGDITTNEEKITTLTSIIEIIIPIPVSMRGRAGLSLYRVHNNLAQELSTTPDGNGEYYTIGDGDEFATLYVKNFSTYALGYTAFSVTIADGGTGAKGAGIYANDDIVSIDAGSKTDYSFNGWTVTSGTVTLADASSASTTFTMPSENVALKANWTYTGGTGGDTGDDDSSATYYIKATAGVGGYMSTAEKVRVKAGESAGFTITPNKGYQIADVKVNGKSIGAKKYYAFGNVRSDQTIHATFKKAGHQNPQTGVDLDAADENN